MSYSVPGLWGILCVWSPFIGLGIECGFGEVMESFLSLGSTAFWQIVFRVGFQNAKYIGQDAITLCMALFR